jgi:hypothetical protein
VLKGCVKAKTVCPRTERLSVPVIYFNISTWIHREPAGNGKPTKVATGERRLICYDPILKNEMEADYNMDLKIQKSNWNQFERHYEGYYRTVVGNVEDTIMTNCRADKRMALVKSKKDLVGFLLILRSICAQNNNTVKVDEEYQNLHTLIMQLSDSNRKSP